MSSRSSATSRKRRRHHHLHPPPANKRAATAASSSSSSSSPSPVLVEDLPGGCTVLELKSRLQAYGPISRIRVEGAAGLVTFRSRDSALAVAAAAADPLGGVVLRSSRLHVSLVANTTYGGSPPTSKLLRAEIPLSKHGRSNKKLSVSSAALLQIQMPEEQFKGREIIAYDDLL